MLPKARKDKLTVRELAEETLVYDLEDNKAHCLNPVAAFVWRHCDGRTSLDKLAALVEQELGIKPGLVVVQLALEQLSGRNLLHKPVQAPSGAARLSRREVLKKLAVAAVGIPIIMTVTAKGAIAGGSAYECPSGTSECNRSIRGVFCCDNETEICQEGQCVPKAGPGVD